MSDVRLDIYIFFHGECAEAMDFYKSVFGGDITKQTYGEVPGMESDHKDWIMHAMLEGGAIKLMGSDTEKASPESKKISLSLGGEDEDQLRTMFDALSEGGKVFSALKKEFWGDTFGSLTDKYGVEWMVNIAAPKE